MGPDESVRELLRILHGQDVEPPPPPDEFQLEQEEPTAKHVRPGRSSAEPEQPRPRGVSGRIRELRNPAVEDRDGIDEDALGPRFQVLRVRGEGGYGIVYEAFDKKTQTAVAAKVIREGALESKNAAERLRREWRSGSKVNHPSIVEVFDFETTPGGLPLVVMELLDGWTVSGRIRAEGPLRPLEAGRMAWQIASAIQALHDHGIIHRDIKPDNIFIQGDTYKLLDLGCVQISDDISITGEGVVVGTLSYMAPEQLRHASVSAQSDVYALGLTLYQSLTGTQPFLGNDPQKLVKAILSTDLDPPLEGRDGLSQGLNRITLKALSKAPRDRYESAGAMAKALEDLLSIQVTKHD